MGIEALAEALDNPIFNIAKADMEAAIEYKSVLIFLSKK